jgi:hypothetical protein|tara:strand:- start:165 stop:473 length:309 start_codon:yes stop_codon:yes gene_type:complete
MYTKMEARIGSMPNRNCLREIMGLPLYFANLSRLASETGECPQSGDDGIVNQRCKANKKLGELRKSPRLVDAIYCVSFRATFTASARCLCRQYRHLDRVSSK